MKKCDLKETHEAPKLETKILREIHERIVKSLLDVIILVELRERTTFLGGYDVLNLVQQEYGVLISSGTIYSVLYSMERKGLIEGNVARSKREYVLTKKGENKIKEIFELKANILELMTKIIN